MLRRIALAGAVAIAALGFGLVHTGSSAAATYTVCGEGDVEAIPGGGSCMTLSDAIAAAQGTSEADVIRMLPGTYCPIDLEGTFAQPIKFMGIGIAGLSGGPISLNGPEAGLTTIEDQENCDAGSGIKVHATVTSGAPWVFENLTVDGTDGGSFGFNQPGAASSTILRDVIIQNYAYPGEGVAFSNGVNATLDIDNSAILNNGVGVSFNGVGSIYDSTIAGNAIGLTLLNGARVSLGSDTISHNVTGVDANCCTVAMQIVDSIVAGNTTADCDAIAGWEVPFGVEGPSSGNLLGDCPADGTGDHDDPTLRNEVPAVTLNGGPTPSIMPPSQAQGFDTPSCGFNGVDQREYRNPESLSCDAGSVQGEANGTPTVNTTDVDLETVAVGSTTDGNVSVSVSGGDLVGVSSVSISGAGWTIMSDGCTYSIMESALFAPFAVCDVGVEVHPTASGMWNGTLTLHTTAGAVVAHLHAQTPSLPPSISGLSTTRGTSGTDVSITGSHLTGATGVAFGGTAAQSFSVVSDSQITAVVAPGTSSGFVSVTTSGGTAVSSQLFVVPAAAPVIRAFSPPQGLVGATVTIVGSGFSGVTRVRFNGTPAVSFVVVSDGTITVTVPVGATSGRVVVSGSGGSSSSARVFTVIPAVAPAPVIASFSPGRGTYGVRVTIRGSGFTGATLVTFNGKRSVFTVANDSTITALVPSGATTGHIAVTTPGGTATSSGTFTV